MLTVAHNTFAMSDPANEELVQHVVCRLRMLVLIRVLHNLANVLACMLENEVVSTGVVFQELGDIEHFAVTGDPAALGRRMGSDVLVGEDANAFGHGEIETREMGVGELVDNFRVTN